MKEAKVEEHLVKRVEETGGWTRKCSWIGRRGAPDRFCAWPGVHAWVETKRPTGGVLSVLQRREHERMRKAGCEVVVLLTIAEVDAWVDDITQGRNRRAGQ